MSTDFEYLMGEAHASILLGELQIRDWSNRDEAARHARSARTFLSLARMELAREVVQEIDSGNGIATPAQWALATKILRPLRVAPTKGGK